MGAGLIRERLFALADGEYAEFQRRLMPTVPRNAVIGVRSPVLRQLARELYGTPEAGEFLLRLPHEYYDENNLHAFLIERIADYDEAMAAVRRFLPYVDNWATCDSMSPRAFVKNADRLPPVIREFLASSETYTVRYGLDLIMSYFLDERFSCEYLELAAASCCDEYYINMAVAWLFATALAKQYEATLPYIERRALPVWTHNKAIQKACESRRLTDEQKAFLRGMKIKA